MSSNNLAPLISSLQPARITVAGDLMLDIFVEGQVERMSPEAPVPVLAEQSSESTPGGAANAALRAHDLEAEISVFGRLGEDEAGACVLECLKAAGLNTSGVYCGGEHSTTRKTRYLAAGRQLLRVDNERCHEAGAEEIAFYASRFEEAPAAILVSDYGKGVVTDELMDLVRARSRQAGSFFIVDPAKGVPCGRYREAALITPNRAECEARAGFEIVDRETTMRAAAAYSESAGGAPVLVTLGGEGSYLFDPRPDAEVQGKFLAAYRQEVFDVTGAGDATASAIVRSLAGGLGILGACRLGMAAGAVAVSRPHTTSMSLDELAAL